MEIKESSVLNFNEKYLALLTDGEREDLIGPVRMKGARRKFNLCLLLVPLAVGILISFFTDARKEQVGEVESEVATITPPVKPAEQVYTDAKLEETFVNYNLLLGKIVDELKAVKKQGSDGGSSGQTITVLAEAANLRVGPGLEYEATMKIPGGTTLVTDAVAGDWLRVIAPSGERLWVAKGIVGGG